MKWIRKHIGIILLTAAVIALGAYWLAWQHSRYKEEEITPELCRGLIQKDLTDAEDVEVISIQKNGNVIVAGYVVRYEAESMGYLMFQESENRYPLLHHTKYISERAEDIAAEFISANNGEYLTVISDNAALRYIQIIQNDQPPEKIEITENPSMVMIPLPENGRLEYTFWDENNVEIK